VQGLRRKTRIAAGEQKVSPHLTSGVREMVGVLRHESRAQARPRRPSPRGLVFAETQERACYLRRRPASGRVGRLARSRSSKPPCSGGGSETFFLAAAGCLAAEAVNSPSSS
jgi:hypothetical protein